MDYHKIDTFNEAKAYFKSLCRPMESNCVLKNLQRILNFLQSPAEEICFVNMQEKYLPFYYMIVLDEEFLQTSFLTDECKVVFNGILKTLEAYRNSFTWEVSFSRQIAGIPVIFRKVYTQPHRAYPRDSYEKPIRLAFKETWIKTTLKFIKSSRLILRYPEMPHREAQYLYKGILKQNDEELGEDSLWAPVWEALNIFKLRYEYIVSIYPTTFEYLKFVCFEKIIIQRKKHAIEEKNINAPLDINEPNFLPRDNTDNDKDKISSNNEMQNVLLPVINHNDLVKTLLEMNFTRAGTIVYTLIVDGSKSAIQPVTVTHQEEINQPSDKDNISSIFKNNAGEPGTTMQDTNLALQDNQAADVSISVQDEVNVTNIQHTDLHITPEKHNEVEFSQETTTLSDSQVNYQNETTCNEDINISKLECSENKVAHVIDAHEKTMKLEINLSSTIRVDKEKSIEDYNRENVISSPENEVNCNNFESQVIEPNYIEVKETVSTVIKTSDTAINLTDEKGNLPGSDETDFVNENPFFQQIIKRQKQSRPLFLEEDNFMSTADINKSNPITNDVILKNKMKMTPSNSESSDPFTNLRESIPPSSRPQTRRQAKMQRRAANEIRQKRRLLDTVSTKFILASFKAILDFMNDDSRASMEMVSLNIYEHKVLRKLHGFSPDMVPIEEMFNDTCLDLAVQLFDRIKQKNEFLEINSIKPSKKMQKYISSDGTRQRAVMFTKMPFKTPRYRINSNSSAGTMNSCADDDSEELRTPKSILEKMHLVPPVSTKMSPGRSRTTSGCNVSRSPSASVSPARPASITPARSLVSPSGHKSEQMNIEPLDLKDFGDKAKRTPAAKVARNLAVTMKTKVIEGLSVPLESDKAMRMMRLMGWNGGALGVRGIGLIEPIQPQLDVPKGVGLGHKIFKSTKLSINRLQRKVMYEKNASEQRVARDAVRKDNTENISKSKQRDKHNCTPDNKNDNVTKIDVFDKSNAFEEDAKIEFNKKSVKNKVTDNTVENQNCTSEIAANSSTDRHVDDNIWMTKSKRENNSEEIKKSFWLTNESILQKINERSTLNNKKMQSKEKLKQQNSLINDALVQKNRETVRSNYDSLMRTLQNTNNGGHDSWRVVDDEKLKPYTHEKRARYFSDRTQFLVHLLDLLQSDGKSFTVVTYVKIPSKMCFGFIDSILWSLKRHIEPTFTLLPGEQRIVEACAREMDAHHWQISYRFEKKFLTLAKFEDFSNCDSLPADVHCSDGFDFVITHSVKDYSFDRQMLIKSVTRRKILTNRIVLEFVKSGDEERVYDYRRSPLEVRSYIISLISLLNRQMTKYQLGLGDSEHPVFREMLHRMKNLCLIYKFDTHDSFINKLQLVKVDLNKRCRICQLGNESINWHDQAGNPHVIDDKNYDYFDDIDIYPNRFDDSKDDDIYKSDSDVIIEKSTNSSQLNNKKIYDHNAYVAACTDEIKTNEEYLIGEDWLDYDVNDETNTENEAGSKTDLNKSGKYKTDVQIITQKEVFDTKENSYRDAVQNATKKNASNEETSTDLHNWPKRVKKSETSNENYTDKNIKWNTSEQYESDVQNSPKRKINMGQRAIKETSKGTIKLNVPDSVLIGKFDNLHDTTNENNNQDYYVELNTDETHAGVVQNVNEREADADIITSDVLMKEAVSNVIKDETREAFHQSAVRVTKDDSNTTHLKSTDVHKWPKTVLVVHHNYPSDEINAKSVQSVQTAIYKAINNGRYLPRIKCHGLKRGGIVYGCYDRESYIWLVENLHGYTLLDYERDVNTGHIVEMKINTFIKVEIEVILKNIELFYDNIKTASWKVIRIKDFESTCVVTINIDGTSLENIRKEDYSLFIGIDKANICVVCE